MRAGQHLLAPRVSRESPDSEGGKAMSARWLARASLLLVLAAVADMVGFASLASLAMVAVGGPGHAWWWRAGMRSWPTGGY